MDVIQSAASPVVVVDGEKRMTSKTIKATKPTIMVTSNAVTKRRSKVRLAGSANSCEVSFMAGSLSQTVVLVLSDNPAPRLDKALAAVVPEGVVFSRSRLVKLIEEGHVRREGGAVVNSVKIKGVAGEVFEVTVPASQDYEAAEAEDIPLDVVYEDDDLIVINKPAGMVVHPAPGSETGTLVC